MVSWSFPTACVILRKRGPFPGCQVYSALYMHMYMHMYGPDMPVSNETKSRGSLWLSALSMKLHTEPCAST